MKILIAEDERVTRRMLETILQEWGHEVVTARDGLEAWQIMRQAEAPRLALIDWIMPGLDGLDVCRRIRELPLAAPPYLILLTVKGCREDIVTGLRGGADDYVTKPFDIEELHARVQAGSRIVDLQSCLAARVRQLEDALSQVKLLQGLLPICCYCKRIRDDHNYWHQLESYLLEHSEVEFTHGICPPCMEKVVKPQLQKLGLPGAELSVR